MASDKKKDHPIRHIALLGNVCVGKTCLFDELCLGGEIPANIPGSTTGIRRGVLAVGPAGASRELRRACARCGRHGARRNGRPESAVPCCGAVISGDAGEESLSECPAFKSREGALLAKEPAAPFVTHLYDTPGSATVAANSEEEIASRNLLLSGVLDSAVVVADAKNLRRSLAFVLEVAEFGLPIVVDLNMLDEAESMGIEVDDAALARELGVPVGRTVAVERIGVRRLAELLLQAKIPTRRARFPEIVEKALGETASLLGNPAIAPRALAMLILSGDDGAKKWVEKNLGSKVLERVESLAEETQGNLATPLKKLLADLFWAEAEKITESVVVRRGGSLELLVRFGALAQRPLSGAIIGFGVLVLAYCWIGMFGAGFIVDGMTRFFDGFLMPVLDKIVKPIPWVFVRDALTDREFGLVPTGLFLAAGIVLPVLFCFFLLQAILEDSGYLPRLAILFDRLFRRLGLNGQGLIPLVMGFSCITMALITTRMLPTRKERVILSFMLVLGIPCAPLLAAMMVILGKMPWTAGAFVFIVIAAQVVFAGYLLGKLMPGRRADLILEIPKMRVPRLRAMWSATWRRTGSFIREALPVFLAASFAVFLFDRLGGLSAVEGFARPIVRGLLGLPDQAVQVFIKTAVRRENGAAELALLKEHFSNAQLVVAMLVMVFLMPCINSAIVLVKERGLKTSMAILFSAAVWAAALGATVNLAFRFLGLTFN